MRYTWLNFFGAIIIWALTGFHGKLSDVEEKYKYPWFVPIIILGIVFSTLYFLGY